MTLPKCIFIIYIVLNSLCLNANDKKLAYIVSDISIPYWQIMSRGVKSESSNLGYSIEVLSSDNSRKQEIKNFATVLNKDVDGIILSPINSDSAVFLLRLAQEKNIPVVILDVGTNAGKYVSYISSDNYQGSYEIGKILAKKMQSPNLKNGTVGIIAIPQQRDNGKERTAGFAKALKENDIKIVGIEQQKDFSLKETYIYSKKLIKEHADLKALFLEGSDKYQAALDAIFDMDKKDEIIIVCFDAEPEFIDLIKDNKIAGAAMQQPYLMGKKAIEEMDNYIQDNIVEKEIKLSILPICNSNINENISLIRSNVLGIEKK